MATTKKTADGEIVAPVLAPVNDLIFKTIFGDPNNAEILGEFLMAVLKMPAAEFDGLEFPDTHALPETEDGKLVILDVKVRTKSGRVIDIEIQVYRVPAMRARILYYASRLVVEQLQKGEKYDKLKPVVSIVISDHPMMREEEECHNVYRLLNTRNARPFADLLEIHTLELPKLPAAGEDTALLNWLQFLKAKTKEDLDMVANRSPGIHKAYGIVVKLSANERMQLLADAREKALKDYNSLMGGARDEGLAEGLAKGLAAGRAEGIAEGRTEGITIGEIRGRTEGSLQALALIEQGLTPAQVRERLTAAG
jgi:predicted transposase/invertase (TIGR01784 family)